MFYGYLIIKIDHHDQECSVLEYFKNIHVLLFPILLHVSMETQKFGTRILRKVNSV